MATFRPVALVGLLPVACILRHHRWAYIFLYKRGFSRVARVVGGSAADFFLSFVSDRNFVILLSFGYFSFGLYLFCKYLCVLVFFFSICVLLCVLY
jgi:hypothetical protein